MLQIMQQMARDDARLYENFLAQSVNLDSSGAMEDDEICLKLQAQAAYETSEEDQMMIPHEGKVKNP